MVAGGAAAVGEEKRPAWEREDGGESRGWWVGPSSNVTGGEMKEGHKRLFTLYSNGC